ncbi:uncharacterized protein LOC135371468 [Ornithodoros turicata]|uniref:uncharacterized protein LOC135371468 n=1 Tax=Ornithodoros turicata TaxID=34597 RepID=UPI0031389259
MFRRSSAVVLWPLGPTSPVVREACKRGYICTQLQRATEAASMDDRRLRSTEAVGKYWAHRLYHTNDGKALSDAPFVPYGHRWISEAALGSVREYCDQATKIIRLECHQRFNRECLKHSVVPQTLRCRPLVDTPYGRKLARDCGINCLNARLLENKSKLNDSRHRLDSAEKALAELLERNKRTEIHDQKLSRMLPKKPPGYDCNNVFNLSSKTLTDEHVSLLSKGLDFALAPRAVPKREIIVEIEDRLRHIKDSTGVNLVRSRIATVLNNVSGPPSNLSKQERSALRDLRSDKSVIVLPADKGKGTVMLDTEDYRTKMQEILDDAAHFVPLAHDPTAKAERSLVDHLRQLKKKGHLEDVTYRRLFSSDGASPRIYGLPKIHEPGCPLRPIVSFIGSPTYNLSKYLVELVTPVTGNNNLTVRNSKEFVEVVRTQAPSNNDVMVSLDVVSLFTNVPKDLAVQVAEDRLRKDSTLPSRTSLTVEEVAIFLRFCRNQTHFCFNGKCYHQIEGCPMGSPVSVTLANLVMEHIEETAMQRFSRPVKFYRRYVDDTFVILDRNHVDEFHSVLNSIESSINFTYEVEQGGKLPFLDICVCRDSTGSIHTCVYRKPCDTGTFLSFESHHPTEHKRSVVRTLLHRSEQLSSCSELRACEDATISASLDKRGYPHRFIEDTRKRMQLRKPQDEDRSRLTRVTIPYVKGVSGSIRRALLPLEIWTTFRPHVKLRSLISKPKDIVAPEDQSVVEEPRLNVPEGILKPDIIARKDDNTFILDAQVVGTGISVGLAHEHKVLRYNRPDVIAQASEVSQDNTTVSSITLSFRGVWAYESAQHLLKLGLTKRDINMMSVIAMQGSIFANRIGAWKVWSGWTTSVGAEKTDDVLDRPAVTQWNFGLWKQAATTAVGCGSLKWQRIFFLL